MRIGVVYQPPFWCLQRPPELLPFVNSGRISLRMTMRKRQFVIATLTLCGSGLRCAGIA